ncbi:TPA: GNAT family N-acetyltransferase [Clostridioides difficile]|nr:GNAT family N-acetyltransferase [Clostridioides difficile]
MKEVKLIKLCENPAWQDKAAWWFSQKWNIPSEDYMESITQCIEKKTSVPQWYVMLNENQDIIAGTGVIENDFHNRKDLSPNLCALYVEEMYRNQGIAQYILEFVRKDMDNMGIEKLYLVTDHTEFYEKCGWSFLTTVKDVNGCIERMYMVNTRGV